MAISLWDLSRVDPPYEFGLRLLVPDLAATREGVAPPPAACTDRPAPAPGRERCGRGDCCVESATWDVADVHIPNVPRFGGANLSAAVGPSCKSSLRNNTSHVPLRSHRTSVQLLDLGGAHPARGPSPRCRASANICKTAAGLVAR